MSPQKMEELVLRCPTGRCNRDAYQPLPSTSDPQEEVLQIAFSLVQLKKVELQIAGTVKACEWSQDGIKPAKDGIKPAKERIEGPPKEPS